MPPKLYAVWDEARSRFTVGRGLIFLEEINVAVREHGAGDVVFVWCSENPPPALFDLPPWPGTVLHYANVAEAQAALPLEGLLTWGFRDATLPCSRDESFLYLQQKCDAQLPVLNVKDVWCRRARAYIEQASLGRRCAVLHLKQNPNSVLSNATLSEWRKFIERAENFAAKWVFIVVGSESPDGLLGLPSVKWTGGETLCLDLALIQEADAFMGMSSGLCQMAMFNTKPYAVFKHPGHHTEEMRREFEGRDGFSFNNTRQRFVIGYDQCETLLDVFQGIVAA